MLAACVILILHAARFFNLADDAYISFRYAENLAAGHGPVFNLGERVEGYTDFLWVVLLALCRLAGAPVPLASQILGIGFSVASLCLAAGLARRFSSSLPGAGLVAAFLLAASPAVARWAVGGLEAPLFSFLALLTVWCFLRDEEAGPVSWRWPAACFLASLARPDGVLLFLVTFFFGLRRSLFRGLGVRRQFLALATYLALGAPYFLWRIWYYGTLLPNTYHAKVAYDAAVLAHGAYYLNYFLFTSGGAVVIAGALLALRRGPPGLRLAVSLAGVYTAYVVLVGGDGEPYSRFLAPVAVLLAPAAEAGYRRVGGALAGLVRPESAPTAPRAFGHALVSPAAITLICCASATGSFFGKHHEEYLVGVEGQARRIAIGEWLGRNAPRDAVVALNPVGVIPYLSGLRTIDMLGLTDAHIGRQGKTVTNRVLFAHNRHDPEYVVSRRPDYLIPGQASTFEVREHMTDLRLPGPSTFDIVAPAFERYFSAFPGDALLWSLPEFRRYYLPTIVETEGRYFYMFVRDHRVEEIETRLREKGDHAADRAALAGLLADKGATGVPVAAGQEAAGAPPASSEALPTEAAPGGVSRPPDGARAAAMQALRQADIVRARGELSAAAVRHPSPER